MELWKFGGHWSVWSLLRNKKIKRESVIGGVNGVNVANGDWRIGLTQTAL